MASSRADVMCGTLDDMKLGQKLTVFSTNNLFLSLHEGTVTPRSLSISVTVSVTLQWFFSTFWDRIWAEKDRKGVFGGEEEGGGVRSGPGAVRTIPATFSFH
jgi:hypothetical protein